MKSKLRGAAIYQRLNGRTSTYSSNVAIFLFKMVIRLVKMATISSKISAKISNVNDTAVSLL